MEAAWWDLIKTRKSLLRFILEKWSSELLQSHLQNHPKEIFPLAWTKSSALSIFQGEKIILKKVDGLKWCMTNRPRVDFMFITSRCFLLVWWRFMLSPCHCFLLSFLKRSPGTEQGHGEVALQPRPGWLRSAEGDRQRQLRQGAAGAAEEDGAHLCHEGRQEGAG